MSEGGSIADVKVLLQARVGDLVRHCAPEGSLQSGYWIAKNPTRADTHAGSFWIICARPGKTPGAWKDEATGEKGDVLDLIAYTQRLDRTGALRWAKDWLGYKHMDPTQIVRARAASNASRADAERIAAAQLAENQARAAKLFRKSKLIKFRGSIADRYLASRGIDLGQLSRVPGALGYLDVMKHTETGTLWPVMVAQLADANGQTRAIHRTFLAADGSGKAPVTPVRKIWPSFKGLAVRLWRGETDLAVDDAVRQGLVDTLCLVEGIEDGLSVALARPDLRIWAAGSLGNLAHVPIPPCAGEIIVCADNDWGKPEAERLLKEALAALARSGRRVSVARSPVGKDFNDCLRASQEAAA